MNAVRSIPEFKGNGGVSIQISTMGFNGFVDDTLCIKRFLVAAPNTYRKA
jgi:hypothetical protein